MRRRTNRKQQYRQYNIAGCKYLWVNIFTVLYIHHNVCCRLDEDLDGRETPRPGDPGGLSVNMKCSNIISAKLCISSP